MPRGDREPRLARVDSLRLFHGMPRVADVDRYVTFQSVAAKQPLSLPGSIEPALAVKTERCPPTGCPPLRQGADALLTASLNPSR
jgi:hypothetical protein